MSVLAVDINVGEHITAKFLGIPFNVDTLTSTVVAGAILVGLGLYMARRASHGVPSRLQLAFETVVDTVEGQVQGAIGPVAPFVVPLAVTLFLFILLANWLAVIPSGHHPEYLPPPTADVNLTYALALLVMGWAVVVGLKRRGIKNYVKGYFKPYWYMFPINMIEQAAKPVSLSLRLFGNLFAGGIMLLLISLLPPLILPPFNILWKVFDLFIGAIQAVIFALLTILYFATELGEGGH